MINKSSCQSTFVICDDFICSLFEKRQKTQRVPPFCVQVLTTPKPKSMLRVLLEGQQNEIQVDCLLPRRELSQIDKLCDAKPKQQQARSKVCNTDQCPSKSCKDTVSLNSDKHHQSQQGIPHKALLLRIPWLLFWPLLMLFCLQPCEADAPPQKWLQLHCHFTSGQ